jgi:demethylmenaquinone methyltransferase/2-methoxy-6-polyprenyl-1,4-benzoquinol methylase
VKNNYIQEMFNNISPHYDFLNHLLSLNIDRIWRKKAIKYLKINNDSKIVLDVACGSGDMCRLLEKNHPSLKIFGIDFSHNMLKMARKKIKCSQLILADVYAAPFKDEIFDRIIIAFGFRNFPDKEKALSELYKLLKKNGILCILELSNPEGNRLFSFFFNFYFKKFLPFVGGMISKNFNAYSYLPKSVYNFPKKSILKNMILSSSFRHVEFYHMTFGLCNAIICYK